MPSSGWQRSSASRPSPRAAASRASAASASAEGAVAVDRQPGMEAVVLRLGEVEMRLGQLARRDLAGAQPGGHLVGVEAGEVGRHRQVVGGRRQSRSPRIAGTTMNSPSRAGGVARARPRRAATAGRRRRAGCSRARSSAPSARCGRSGPLARIAYWSRMWFSWPSSRASSSSREPEPGEVGDVLDVGAREGGHAPDDSRGSAAVGRPRRRVIGACRLRRSTTRVVSTPVLVDHSRSSGSSPAGMVASHSAAASSSKCASTTVCAVCRSLHTRRGGRDPAAGVRSRRRRRPGS